MNVVIYPNPSLKMAAQPVLRIDSILRQQIQDMFQLMYATNGIGLAGPQVELPYRVFVMNYTGDPEKKDKEMVFINPVILRRSGKLVVHEEGCLSFPGIFASVVRPERVTVRAFNLKGEMFTATFEALAGRCVQHEYDHLDGYCFIDRLEEPERRRIQKKLDKQIERYNAGETINTGVENKEPENASSEESSATEQ